MNKKYIPIEPLPSDVERLDLNIQMSKRGLDSLLYVLEDPTEVAMFPALACGVSKSKVEEYDFKIWLFRWSNIDEILNMGSKGVLKIEHLDFVVFQPNILLKANMTTIDRIKGQWIFNRKTH